MKQGYSKGANCQYAGFDKSKVSDDRNQHSACIPYSYEAKKSLSEHAGCSLNVKTHSFSRSMPTPVKSKSVKRIAT